jgi:predicted small lipoprotein YifL
MKKLLTILGVILIMLSLAGCLSGLNAYPGDDKVKPDEMAQRIVDALDAKDKEALKAVFSEKALSEADDLDEGIAYIFDQYKGFSAEITTPGNTVVSHFGLPERTKVFYAKYFVTTDQGEYVLCFTYWAIEDTDSTMVGVNDMRLLTSEEWEHLGSSIYGKSPDPIGIYHPGWDE